MMQMDVFALDETAGRAADFVKKDRETVVVATGDDRDDDESSSSLDSSSLDEFVDGLVSSRGDNNNSNLVTKALRRVKQRRRDRRKRAAQRGDCQTKGDPDDGVGAGERGDLLDTMEGLIWNADKIMDRALRPGLEGIRGCNFATCAGVCLMSSVQVGAAAVSGHVGKGIFMKHNVDGTWSNPVACGVTGFGFGPSLGATQKDALIFITDYEAVESFYRTGIRLGGKVNLTCGVGRSAEGHVGVSPTGTSATYTISYGHGMYLGAALTGDVIGPRRKVNEAFYGEVGSNDGCCDPASIVNGTIPFPTTMTTTTSGGGAITVIDDLKEKLARCCSGQRGGNQSPLPQAQTAAAAAAACASPSAPPSDAPHAADHRVATTTAIKGFKNHLLGLCNGGGPWRNPSPPATTAEKQQEDGRSDILDRMMRWEEEPLAGQEERHHPPQGRGDNDKATLGGGQENLVLPGTDEINALIRSSLIVHVEPDWQSTRQL